tara:strand:+ start:466 stop:678 length:213 start_codon:yes stop_codon:yes gene_type:complete
MSVNSVQISSAFNAQISSNRTVDLANNSIIEIEQMKSLLFLGVRGEVSVQENKNSQDIFKGYLHIVDFLV